MNRLFGTGNTLTLDVVGLQKTLIRNMLQVHIASIEKRLESCERCPLICENPAGFKAEAAIDPTEEKRLQNFPNIPKGTKLPYYEGLRKRIKTLEDDENKEKVEKKATEETEEETDGVSTPARRYPRTPIPGAAGERDDAGRDSRELRSQLRGADAELLAYQQ